MSEHKLVACHECDLLVEVNLALASDQKLCCPRCGHTIISGHKHPLDYTAAMGLTALLLLSLAISYPFMSFESRGLDRTISLVQASSELLDHGFTLLGGLVYCFILILPFIYLIAILVIVLPLKLGMKTPSPILWGKLIARLEPWVMAEVFLVGVLVALIKIIAMADIILGLAFWAYVLFTVVFIYLSSVANTHRIWAWIDKGRLVNGNE